MASMAGAPRVRSLNIATPEVEARPVLVPGGNKTRSGPANARKPSPKPLRKAEPAAAEKPAAAAAKEEEGAKRNAVGGGGGGAPKGASPVPSPRRTPPGPPPRRTDAPLLQPSLPLSSSCSSDASAELVRTRAFAGRVEKSRSWSMAAPKQGKAAGKVAENKSVGVDFVVPVTPAVEGKRRCAWATPTTDPFYVTYHDEEWGVPVHDDRRLFELLVLSCALAELTWPEILKRRQLFREIFMDFDPAAVSKMNEKKLVAPGSVAHSVLSEPKLRAVLENARQILKIADEFGSFDRYCWGFLNHKPIVSKFRYPRQVPLSVWPFRSVGRIISVPLSSSTRLHGKDKRGDHREQRVGTHVTCC